MMRLPPMAKLGLILAGGLILLALVGPWVAPGSPTSPGGLPYAAPSTAHPFGTDALGRDVLTRILHGGRSVILLATISTAIAILIGTTLGMVAAWRQRRSEHLILRTMDVFLATPAILVVSVLALGIGRGWPAIMLATTLLLIPDLVRLVRSATLPLIREDYVESALVRGERDRAILVHELLPGLIPTLAADAGLRLLGATSLVASASFLGLGLQPPAADWAVMIQENRAGFLIQPWATITPTLLIATFCLSACWIGDGIAQIASGRTVDTAR
ncbi:MAG: ABC transporter permease [Thermomicrobiales bacterium]